MLFGETQQERERVTVGRHRSRAHRTLSHEIVGKELLDQRGE
jgi:hypothetical protein